MSWLSDEQLCKKVEKNANTKTCEAFYGVCPLDELPSFVSHYPIFIIVNTQSHNLAGEHWKCIFIDKHRNGELFDSLAEPPNVVLIQWMNRFTRKWKRNRKVYQRKDSTTCGAFVLYYILNRLDFSSLNSFSQCFTPSMNRNECLVRQFYSKLK